LLLLLLLLLLLGLISLLSICESISSTGTCCGSHVIVAIREAKSITTGS
jgi:hypothetical protein